MTITSQRLGFLTAGYDVETLTGIALTNALATYEFVDNQTASVAIPTNPPRGSVAPSGLYHRGMLKSLFFKLDNIAGGAAFIDWVILHGIAGGAVVTKDKITHTVRTAIELDTTDLTEGIVAVDLNDFPYNTEHWYQYGSAVHHTGIFLGAKLDVGTATGRVTLAFREA